MSHQPTRTREWLRQKIRPWPRRTSEGADSVLPHQEEFYEQPDSGRIQRLPQEARQPNTDKPSREKH